MKKRLVALLLCVTTVLSMAACGNSNGEAVEILYSPALANRIWIMRKFLADMNCIEAMELLQNRMNRYGTNEALLQNMDKDDM